MATAPTPTLNDFWTHFKSLEKLADSASLDVTISVLSYKLIYTDESTIHSLLPVEKGLCKPFDSRNSIFLRKTSEKPFDISQRTSM